MNKLLMQLKNQKMKNNFKEKELKIFRNKFKKQKIKLSNKKIKMQKVLLNSMKQLIISKKEQLLNKFWFKKKNKEF